MSKALKSFGTTPVAQTEKANSRQVKNSAGGYVYGVSDVTRLERFLILGTDGGTYYASEKDITKQNVDFLIDFAGRDPRTFIKTVVDVSVNNRAAKNSPAIFALAVAMNTVPADVKAEVRAAVQQVCRTSTHLFEFAQYVENLGGWGRAKKSAVAEWYQGKDAGALALQAVKYRQRDGWTHRDLLRLSHPAMGPESVPVVNFMLGKDVQGGPPILEGFRKVQAAKTVDEVIALVVAYRLPWETVPTQFLREPALWKAFVENRTIGHTAILRNVRRMEEIGAFKDLKFAKTVADILSDPEEIHKGRLHPVAFLNAWGAYDGSLPGRWGYYDGRRPAGTVTPVVTAALEDGFYASFANVEPSKARTMLGMDVSGSMTMGEISGLKNLIPLQASAAMASVTLRTEPYVTTMAFSSGFVPLNLSPRDNLGSIIDKMRGLPFSGTDCAVPMLHAAKNNLEIDHFVIYTDNETWQGNVHADKALRDYRQKSGINAKLTVVGMTATNFTIADPSDAGMLDVVGFDSAAPRVIADFARVK
jgi:60 kDa SS-A/Ro ribonucleoprotein